MVLKRTFDSLSKLLKKNEIYNSNELHIYELIKLLRKVQRNECKMKPFRGYLTENDFELIDGRRRADKHRSSCFPKLSEISI